MEAVRVMGAFDVLQRILSVYNSDNFRDRSIRIVLRNACQAALFSIILLCVLLASMAVLWQCFEAGFDAVAQTMPLSVVLETSRCKLVYVTLWSKNRKIASTIGHLQEIIEKRNRRSMEAAARYSRLEAALTRIFRVMATIFVIALGCVNFITMAVNIWFSAAKTLPVRASGMGLIDRTTNVGFYVLLLVESLSSVGYATILLTSILLYINLCFYVGNMVKDLSTELSKIDRHLLFPSQQRLQRDAILPCYIEQIEFHREIIWLAEMTENIMNEILFHQLLTCAIMEALCLYSLESSAISNPDNVVTLYMFSNMIFTTYVLCYLSETITQNLLDVGHVLYQTAWFMLPAKQQLIFKLAIGRSQATFHMKGMGLIDCSLGVFITIIRTGCSYFLMIRGLK